MKKAHFGIMLFTSGIAGFLILSLYLAENPCNFNGIGGLCGALLGSELLIPYILFCVLGIAGLFICAVETFFRKK